MIEKLFGSTPAILGDFVSWLYLVAILVVLTSVAFLLSKKPVARKVISILLLVGIVGLLIIPTLDNNDLSSHIWNGGFTPYMMIVVALVLLYGLLCEKSKLAQALYGITASVALPMSLLRILFPTWTSAKSILGITSSGTALVTLLIYCVLFFVAVWLIASGTYRLTLSTMWHVLYGFVVFGSIMVFTAQAGLSTSHAAINMMTFFGADGLIWANIADIALPCIVGLAVIFVISLAATLWRKYVCKTEEKVIVSETKKAFVLRLVGKIVAVATSGAFLVFMPNILGANITNFTRYYKAKAEMVGFPTALAFLAPIVLLAVIMLVFEFLAEDHEIQTAQEKQGIIESDEE